MSRRDFFQLFCMFYLQCINRKCAKEKNIDIQRYTSVDVRCQFTSNVVSVLCMDFDNPKRFFNTQKVLNQMIKSLRPYHESCWKRVTVSLQQSQACSRQCSFPKWTDPFQISSLHSQINWSWKLHFRICWMKKWGVWNMLQY